CIVPSARGGLCVEGFDPIVDLWLRLLVPARPPVDSPRATYVLCLRLVVDRVLKVSIRSSICGNVCWCPRVRP
ncbi:MAG: hypothetical protein KDC10_12480, partial [Calditrichaeota bacterium]|nr:hypothetical protein [Calditrichota bacterium]